MIPSRKIRLLAAASALFIFLAAPPVTAREAQSEKARASGAPAAEARPALWKISDRDTTIYLFGTIHILPEELGWFRGPVKRAFRSADQVVTETMTDSPETLQAIFAEKGIRRDGRTLRESLDDTQRENLEKSLSDLGLAVNSFDQFESWYAGLLLSLIPLKAAGYDQAKGVENQIDAMAKASGVARHPLETAEYQIGLFAALPEASQRAYLSEVLEQLPTLKEDVAKLVKAWRRGRAEELAELLNDDESDETMRKVLITDRNQAWAKWLEGRLAQPGVVFVAVGAGHLAGAGSVQEQLSRDGIRTVRVQ
ncbi:hypothetical protein EDF57_101322 [Novosphingobium sp. PhB55]|uniref:TraB/GumN family protein n=1 Tax=Novosphingobium sp. PhB55 TaxID=2485106 RepID=UPI00106503C6|nr:TraB/GumN family protein [Novosphingobium sp. PhB55]TDW68436.1 hypothetical protein EDF57_101322 [Novosphingobium sp. PhB55]